jgi:hypothetical protein
MVPLISTLGAEGDSDAAMAPRFTAQGHRSPSSQAVLPHTVRLIRLKQQLFQQRSQSHPRHIAGALTVPQRARPCRPRSLNIRAPSPQHHCHHQRSSTRMVCVSRSASDNTAVHGSARRQTAENPICRGFAQRCSLTRSCGATLSSSTCVMHRSIKMHSRSSLS